MSSDPPSRQHILNAMQKCEEKHGKVVSSVYTEYVARSQILRHFDSVAEAKMEAGISNLGAVRSQAMRNQLNQYFEENNFIQDMTIGMLMGDSSATKNTEQRNTQIQLELRNREFAEHVREIYGPLATDVKTYQKNSSDISYNTESMPIYKLRTRRLKCFNRFRDDWYMSENKRYPIEKIDMNPVILKYWYACDGDMATDNRWNTKHYARITCNNEDDRREEVNSLFEGVDFTPNWNDGGRFTFGRYGSINFWNYIGRDVPGYQESKCPDTSYFEEDRNQL